MSGLTPSGRIKFLVTGARGGTFADVARASGAFGANSQDSDSEVFNKFADYAIEQNPDFKGDKGDKGDTGGNVEAIGLFSDIGNITVPVGTDAVRTSGRNVLGLGISDYTKVPSGPATEFRAQSQDGRWFERLDLDPGRFLFGFDNLGSFRNRIADGISGNNIVMTGDSTTEAAIGADSSFIPTDLLLRESRNRGAFIQKFYNRGQSGKRTSDWLSTYLAGDLTAASGGPGQLMIIRWGTNDADNVLSGGPYTPAQTVANIDSALTTIRASYPLNQLSILLMAPNASVGRGRNEEYNEELCYRLKQLSYKHHTAYFDTYNFARDVRANIGISWDDSFGDGTAGIHPRGHITGLIYKAVADFLFEGLGRFKRNNFMNLGSSDRTLAASTLPASYEYGVTIDRALTAQGFPGAYDGEVVSFRGADTALGMQMHYANEGVRFRIAGGANLDWALVPITYTGSVTYDPPSLADGAGVTTTVTCAGAAMGDYARASFSNDIQGISVTAWVSAANTVSVRLQNESGGVIDLASGTLRVRSEKF